MGSLFGDATTRQSLRPKGFHCLVRRIARPLTRRLNPLSPMGCRVVSLRGSEVSGEGVLELGAIVALALPPVRDAEVLRPHLEGLEVAR